MSKLLFVFLIAAFYASANAGSGNRQCPGGYSHGSQMDVGRYWYECKDGQMIPKGCLTEEGRRVDVDNTFDTKEYRMQCLMGPDGYLTVVYKACVLQGSEHDVGSQWDDGTAAYTCVKEGNNVRVTMLGCIDQGRPMKFEERVAKGEFIYQCKKSTDGTPKMNKVGCVHEGRKYNIGESFEGPKFWYTCTDSGSRVVGCMFESQRLRDGDHFTRDDMMYSCRVTDAGADLEPFACMAHENGAPVERRVGCSWVEGDYEYKCEVGNDNRVAKIKKTCNYRGPTGGNIKVQPGCILLVDPFAAGCHDSGSGSLRLETYSADMIDRIPGLRRC